MIALKIVKRINAREKIDFADLVMDATPSRQFRVGWNDVT